MSQVDGNEGMPEGPPIPFGGKMVRCKDCGFLAVRAKVTEELVEAKFQYRRDGNTSSGHAYPVCFCDAVDMEKAIQDARTALGKNPGINPVILKVINDERHCFRFTPWMREYSPREHQELIYTAETVRSEQEWREKQAEKERQWRAEDLAREQQWRIETLALDAARRKEDVENQNKQNYTQLWITGLLFLAINAAVQLIAAFISRG